MAYEKKTWQNRVSQYPTRRVLTEVSGSEGTYDVTRAEGTVTTQGDSFSADTTNDMETRIDDAFTEVNESLGTQVTFTLSGTTLSINTK